MDATTTEPKKISPALQRVEAAAEKMEAVRQKRDETIVNAYVIGGASLRAIEEASGLSHETIRTILRRAGVDTTKAAKRAKKETKR